MYATLFGIGKIVFGELTMGIGLLALAALASYWIARSFREERAALDRVPAATAMPAAS